MPSTTPTGAPRWTVLLPLVVLVLLAHLWLMAGELPVWSPAPVQSASPGADPADGVPAPPPEAPATATQAAAPVMPVQVSQVRWLTAPATPAKAAEPEQPPRRPTPAPAAPTPPAETPAPAETAAPPEAPAAMPPPPPEVARSPETPPPEPPPLTVAAAEAAAQTPAAPGPTGDALPADPVPSMTLKYKLSGKAKGLNYTADAVLQWSNDGQRYSAQMEISAFLLGSRVQTSEGQVGPGGLAPERFGDRRRGTEKATHFDQAGRRIRFSSNAPEAPLLPGAQDRLSVFLQLGALLKSRPTAYPPGSAIELQVAGPGSAEVWRFEVGEVQVLSLPTGSISALRLVRGPRNEHDNTVEIWLAAAHGYLPARIRLTDADGGQVDQQLLELPPQVLQ